MSVILLGYRGSGKTTIGRTIAAARNEKFVDTDDLIIATTGKTIREIFERYGEVEFRDIESAMLRDACARHAHVIALGGGAILRDENRALLKSITLPRIYLRCDASTLHARIHADPQTAANRPSLTHLGGSVDEVRAMLTIREPLYREVMTDEVDVSRLPIEMVVRRVLSLLSD